ncbi:hypothetical protein BKA82DRAFT_1002082 [Pisolithus tinctorius]|nr:hypothetical protein BKA82DRAFT_1002082 [Pisolithus tinctorius]
MDQPQQFFGAMTKYRSNTIYDTINHLCSLRHRQYWHLRLALLTFVLHPDPANVAMDHTLSLLHDYENSRQYSVQDFFRFARTRTQVAGIVVACDLYHIPSRSSWYHEFLLVHVDMNGERLMLVVERVPSNRGMRVVSSNGGVAIDTITVLRVTDQHVYWQRASEAPVCKGTLLWHHPTPRLLDIAFFASAASTTFKYYNFYTCQCYWYARVTLAAMASAFPSCSREGTTSFSKKRLTVLGCYKPSQVQLIVDLHINYCQDLHPSPVETERHPSRLVIPDILFGLAAFIFGFLRFRFLALLTFPEPDPDTGNRHSRSDAGI